MYHNKQKEEVMRKKKVLVVDDDPAMRELIKNTVEALGYHVSAAVGDGERAMNFLKNNCDEVEAVITDYNMPEMDGEALTRWIKSNRQKIKVAFTSVADIEDFRAIAEAAKADAVFSKMKVVAELPTILEDLIGPADPFEMIARK